MTPVTRADVVACARRWIGTPYVERQRLRGVGVDCVGLLIGVARDLGFMPRDFEVPAYTGMPDGVSLVRQCDLYLDRIGNRELIPGDVAVIVVDKAPQHLGIITPYRHGGNAIIHATNSHGIRKVIEVRLVWNNAQRFKLGYSFRGVV